MYQDAPESSFSTLETKLTELLSQSVGGSPTVAFIPSSDDIRSSLELDITLSWSFVEASQLKIDLGAIFDGLDLDEDIKMFAKVRFSLFCLYIYGSTTNSTFFRVLLLLMEKASLT